MINIIIMIFIILINIIIMINIIILINIIIMINIIIFFYICVFSGWFMIAQRIDGCLVKIWKEGFAKPTSTPHNFFSSKPRSTPQKIYLQNQHLLLTRFICKTKIYSSQDSFSLCKHYHCANITLCANIIIAMEYLANADAWQLEDFQWNGRV